MVLDQTELSPNIICGIRKFKGTMNAYKGRGVELFALHPLYH